ncbi:hypothetical protein EDB83DRAFT_2309678 [Lactarius deliciosus]|nr:hypothetical protein EDB83DRAFT_2309678 [Lactarius deliciosus]
MGMPCCHHCPACATSAVLLLLLSILSAVGVALLQVGGGGVLSAVLVPWRGLHKVLHCKVHNREVVVGWQRVEAGPTCSEAASKGGDLQGLKSVVQDALLPCTGEAGCESVRNDMRQKKKELILMHWAKAQLIASCAFMGIIVAGPRVIIVGVIVTIIIAAIVVATIIISGEDLHAALAMAGSCMHIWMASQLGWGLHAARMGSCGNFVPWVVIVVVDLHVVKDGAGVMD